VNFGVARLGLGLLGLKPALSGFLIFVSCFPVTLHFWNMFSFSNSFSISGLLIFASKVATVLQEFTGVDALLMGDITYGACCVDDTTAALLGAQLLVHYGHSCLVPTSVASRIPTIYVFVTIQFSVEAAVTSIQALLNNFEKKSSKKIQIEREESQTQEESSESDRLCVSLVSTIQFANSLLPIKTALEQKVEGCNREIAVTIPRSKPLSSGEILGCTAPRVNDDVIVYVGDGRFHLEAMMMANPTIPAYRCEPLHDLFLSN